MSYKVEVHLITPRGEIHVLDGVDVMPNFVSCTGGFFTIEGRDSVVAVPLSNIEKIWVERE